MRDEAWLQPCGPDIRQEAASGVEHVRAHADAPPWDDNRHPRVERLQPKRYRANLGSRHDLPQGAGTQRPRGLPAGEEKRRHLAVARRLDAISAQDCRRCSAG
jgi:hypothetical protein